LITLPALFLFALISGCANFSTYEPAQYEIKFGILKEDGDNFSIVEETNDIPFKVGLKNLTFGYVITPSHENRFKYSANVILPGNPIFLEGSVKGSKYQASTKGIQIGPFINQGKSALYMGFNTGDKRGKHQIKLTVNGAIADERVFNVN